MKKIFFSSLGFMVLLVFGITAQEGAFNLQTGVQLSEEEWKEALPDSFYLFSSETPMEITIESDFKNLRKRKHKEEYQEALLHFDLNENIVVKRKIRIKARGEFRKRFCHFPPIRLNFKKTEFLVSDIQDLEKLKMVTNCKQSEIYETYLLREYLVYKLFNALTDKSFRARLLRVKYIDTGRKNKTWEAFAFLIEEVDRMAARSNGSLVAMEKLSQSNMHPKHMTMVAVFNYMIGNTDWSIPGQHNMKIIQALDPNEPKFYPVPYDFDYSGFVNTDYAAPTDGLGIDDVRERIFQGYCRTEEEFQEVIDFYLEKEQALYEVIETFPYLDKWNKLDGINYLESFFESLKLPKANKKLFQSTCRR